MSLKLLMKLLTMFSSLLSRFTSHACLLPTSSSLSLSRLTSPVILYPRRSITGYGGFTYPRWRQFTMLSGFKFSMETEDRVLNTYGHLTLLIVSSHVYNLGLQGGICTHLNCWCVSVTTSPNWAC